MVRYPARLILVTTLLMSVLLSACSTSNPQYSDPVEESLIYGNETMLLVSLGDGSVIMQTIPGHADVCFKKNSDSSTTCLTRGEPILDQSQTKVIGFEMTEDQLDLVSSRN